MARKIATNTSVDRQRLLDFVRLRHRMVLITRREDGTPQASSVTGGVDDSGNIAGEHSDWDEFREAMRRQGRSLLRITPARWGPVATGGFPAELVQD